MLNNDNRFDIDLPIGQMYERELQSLLMGNIKIEVKAEIDIWDRYGNIAIEYSSRGKKSGISVTEAEYWCHVLTSNGKAKMMFMLPVDRLKSYIKRNWSKLTRKNGGDDFTSELILIPIKDIHRIAYDTER